MFTNLKSISQDIQGFQRQAAARQPRLPLCSAGYTYGKNAPIRVGEDGRGVSFLTNGRPIFFVRVTIYRCLTVNCASSSSSFFFAFCLCELS